LAIPFDFDGNLLFTDADSLKHLGRCDPFLAYCAFLFAASTVLPRESLADLDTHLKVMSQQPKLWQETMSIKYQELKQAGGASAVLHKTKDIPLRKGWEKGCELGFMDELADLVGQVPAGKGLDLRLREALNAIQVDIDIACEAVEEQKSRLTRDKVSAILD
jgi:3-keto-L-gulonate-6-phosphate decarboxylase